jgi:hypothetical protein
LSATSFYIDQPRPPGDWIGWRAWFELTGSQHYGPDVARFATAAKRSPRSVASAVLREPDNPYDRNALSVIGVVDGNKWKLGYVPRDEARDLAAFSPNMPLAVRIISARFAGDGVYVKVQLLVPSKKARHAQGW